MSEQQQSDDNPLFLEYISRIADLHTFRDKYYLLNKSNTAHQRNLHLQAQLALVLTDLATIKEQLPCPASYLILVGKAHNCLPAFNQTACDSLKKATKLEPKSMEAWNQLGECYWKKSDFEMCRICFEQSLSVARNKLALRGMSMVIRQLIDVPGTSDTVPKAIATIKYEHIKNSLDESIKLAKECVELDMKDGMSWYILANCYVSKFFSPFGQQNVALLRHANVAYTFALKDKLVASLQSDLYFNKSMISMYEENWKDALWCLSYCVQLEPHWKEAHNNLQATLDYLTQLNEMCLQKGKLKPRKFQALIKSIKASDLGPYQRSELKEVDLSEMTKGLNKGRMWVGKVVCGLPTKHADNIVCFSAVVADGSGECAALSIYNLASGEGVIIGQSVCVPEPWLESEDFEFGAERFKFRSLRVENPQVLVVNGKKWTKDKVSSAFFVPQVMIE